MPASLVQGILDEIESDAGRAIEATLNDLPSGFPEGVVGSVIEGIRPASAPIRPRHGMSRNPEGMVSKGALSLSHSGQGPLLTTPQGGAAAIFLMC